MRPTVVNNVETLAAVVPIINMGGEEYAKIGVGKSTGTKLISACGNINKPGVYEIDMTISVEEFIYSDEYCGGIANGKRLKACIPGGSSVPILPANLLLKTAKGETRLMNYESLSDGGFATGSMMGSGGFIVLDEDQCIVKNTYTLARFYRHESCGQCSPCREGTGWMEKILIRLEKGEGKMSDIDLLWDIQRRIEGNTICPLGDAAAWPVAAAIRHFRDEFEWHVTNAQEAQTRNYGLAHYADEIHVPVTA
jgi:NADH-quinone oxidoreductase subunit F